MLLLREALSVQIYDRDKALPATLGISYSFSNFLFHFKTYLNCDFPLVYCRFNIEGNYSAGVYVKCPLV